jgi:poly(3-hydroxybutyrate) depolymerase
MMLGRTLAILAIILAIAVATAMPAAALPKAPEKPKPAPTPTHLVDSPCAGCRAILPPGGTTPVPLLVVLHGDWGHGPAELLGGWQGSALPRGVAVLSLQCPRDLGCKNSWWQWNGDPAWVNAQVDALAAKAQRPIDRDRVWIAGWSGGATYIGMRSQTFQRTFAALVYHGGGIAPFDSTCNVQASSAPAFFLTGTGNALHSHVVHLRQHHESCKDEVVWKVLPGADHPAEWKALEANSGTILEWLLKKQRVAKSEKTDPSGK